MNILFVMPLNIPFKDCFVNDAVDWKAKRSQANNLKRINLAYPNGFLSIASYIKKYDGGIDVKIIDFNALLIDFAMNSYPVNREYFWDYCLETLGAFKPDIIGISGMFASVYYELPILADYLKSRYKDALLVSGGHYSTVCYQEIFKMSKCMDAVCFGEGEIPFKELTDAYKKRDVFNFLEADSSWITRTKSSLSAGGGGGDL